MLKDTLTCGLQKYFICKLLFLAFLAIFAQSPIADAYSDSLCSSDVFNDLNDADSPVSIDDLKLNDAGKFHHALKSASEQNHDDQTPASQKDNPSGHTAKKPQNSANDIKSSQCCPPLSSDPSPPLV